MDKETCIKAFNLYNQINDVEREIERAKKDNYITYIANSRLSPLEYTIPRTIIETQTKAATALIIDHLERHLVKLKTEFENL